MNPSRRLLAENIGSLYALQAANYIIPLIMLPYLVRTLGTANFGLLALAQATMQYFMVLTDFGFNLTTTRQISIHRKDPQNISRIFSNVMAIKAILLLLSFVLVSAAVTSVPKLRANGPVYFAAFLMVPGNALFPLWYFQGIEKMKYITLLNTATKVVAAVAVFVFVRGENDYLKAAFIQSSGSIAGGVLGMAAAVNISKVRFIKPSIVELRETFVESWHVFTAQASATMFGPANIFILGMLTNYQIVGMFSIAEKIVRAVVGLTTPISNAIYPRTSELFSKAQSAAFIFLRKVLLLGVAVFAMLSIGLFFGSNIIISLISGENNPSIGVLVKVMAILPLTVFIDNIYGTQIMLNLNMQKQFRNAVLYSSIVALALSLLLVPRFHALGSAVSLISSEILVLALMILPVHRKGIRLHRRYG